MSLYQRWLDQLIKWCECGQKAHAWHMAQEMEKECPMLEGLAAELTKTMKARNDRPTPLA
jgi:hypothetical protein